MFEVRIYKVSVLKHPNADLLEIAMPVGTEYQSVVKKGQFKTGDLVAYIPEQALIPEKLLDEMGLKGKLAGSQKNRVKAIKLRGVLSQGICHPVPKDWALGQNVAERLKIIKWEPPIPLCFAGEQANVGTHRFVRYDIENYKYFPDIFSEHEDVVITEKIHGSLCQISVEVDDFVVSSKGLGAKGLALKDNERNEKNVYIRVAKHLRLDEKFEEILPHYLYENKQVVVVGEVFGRGIQDLNYGASSLTDKDIGFRVFDMYLGPRGHGKYLNSDELDQACEKLSLERVPILYKGCFSNNIVKELTSGRESVSGKDLHLREGVVVRAIIESFHPEIGRKQLKSVSEKYLLRRGGTEFN